MQATKRLAAGAVTDATRELSPTPISAAACMLNGWQQVRLGGGQCNAVKLSPSVMLFT